MRTLFMTLFTLLVACGPKQAPSAATTGASVTLAMSQVQMKSGEVIAVPEALSRQINKALTKAGVQTTALPVSEYPDTLNKRTMPTHRASALVEVANQPSLLVLVEAKALFYSQLRGQNRWVVSVEATAVAADSSENAIARRFDVPVFLRYNHEREAEALSTAGPTIARRVERLVRDALSLAEAP